MHATREVDPIKPVAPYFGGKSKLASRLIEYIDQVDHKTYAEPFVGMGGVFFRRTKVPRAEVINDFNKELATLYRILQRHYPQFRDCLKYQITSRAEFERLKKTDPETLTDLERSARFLYIQRNAFGGKQNNATFGVSVERPGRFDVTKLAPMLEDLHTRLSGVVIECLSFEEFIKRYDRSTTLFYLDPPYYGCENDYGKELFKRSDFEVLSGLLAEIKGRFILSLNDHPEVRRIFGAFKIDAVETTYSVARNPKNGTRYGELIISN